MDVYIDAAHAIQHNKTMLIDGRTLITGSFNFSRAAEERNAENLLIIRDKLIINAAYAHEFEAHLDHSERYVRPATDPEPVVEEVVEGEVYVFVTRSGRRYHTERCQHAEGAQRVTLQEAQSRRLTPCGVCRP